MNKYILYTICCLLQAILFAQLEGFAPVANPITLTTFQFLKYGEIPINEYNGIPDISIPFYTIEASSIKYPIVLKYHTGGIRVTEEVGSVWDGI